jgi:hypothetical protein
MESAPGQKSEAVYTLTTPGEYKYVVPFQAIKRLGWKEN